jgi:pantetheine-phosphate adenylyltransferase
VKVLFSGSFNPIHEGHLDIILRASNLFEKVYIAISINENKKYLKNIDERYEETKKQIFLLNLENVYVLKNEGLTIDIAKKYQCNALIRSIRNFEDMDYEFELANKNKNLSKELNIETIFLVSNKNFYDLNSTKLRKGK